MFATTVEMATLSLTFIPISIPVDTPMLSVWFGRMTLTKGVVTSEILILVVSVLFLLLDESFATKEILYWPMAVGAVKDALYLVR